MPVQARNSKKTFPLKLLFTRVLEHLSKKAKKAIRLTLGVREGTAEWARMDKETKWILTVPAIWGDRARQFMIEAAVEAGLAENSSQNNVIIALEPEGAALACREDLLKAARELTGKSSLSHILRYMVVDCGGGTVDITIHDLDRQSMTITEVHKPTGGAWGGTCVDDEVKKLIEVALGHRVAQQLTEEDWLEVIRVNVELAKQNMDENTEKVTIKLSSQFLDAVVRAGGDLSKLCSTVDGVTYRKRTACLVVDAATFGKCFRQTLERISSHVESLLNIGGIECILVVGGFAESPFLIKHLAKRFDQSKYRVIRPVSPSMAILKGALMYGQNPNAIVTRISKFTYGIGTTCLFDPSVHPPHLKFAADGRDICMDIFSKIVEAGEAVRIGKVEEMYFPPSWESQVYLDFKIFKSSDKNVMYTTGEELLTTISVTVPKARPGRDRTVKVQIDFGSTVLHFKAWSVDGGNPVDVDVKFHHD